MRRHTRTHRRHASGTHPQHIRNARARIHSPSTPTCTHRDRRRPLPPGCHWSTTIHIASPGNRIEQALLCLIPFRNTHTHTAARVCEREREGKRRCDGHSRGSLASSIEAAAPSPPYFSPPRHLTFRLPRPSLTRYRRHDCNIRALARFGGQVRWPTGLIMGGIRPDAVVASSLAQAGRAADVGRRSVLIARFCQQCHSERTAGCWLGQHSRCDSRDKGAQGGRKAQEGGVPQEGGDAQEKGREAQVVAGAWRRWQATCVSGRQAAWAEVARTVNKVCLCVAVPADVVLAHPFSV